MDSRKLTRAAAAGCVLAVAALIVPVCAEGAAPDKYLELLRSDVRTSKVELLTEALNLTDGEAAAFWPLYRAYDAELAALGDRRVALVKRFVEKYGTMTNEDAGAFAKDWFALQKDRLALREKYFGKIGKATNNRIASRFVQVENVLGMILDLQIAAELPLME